ncbi:hypothetical protein Tsubulata_048563, partial [Turnera subulata]
MAVQAQLYPESLGLWMVNNPVSVSGLEADLCFANYPQQQPPHPPPPEPTQDHFLQQQRSQNYGFDTCTLGPSSSSSSTCDSSFSMALSQSLDAHLEMQTREVDCILRLQSERLRSTLQEQRKRQLSILLKSMESKASWLMRQKEEDLAQARKRNMELEACLRRAQKDGESWQQMARSKEATIVDLNKSLEQVRERVALASNRAHDAESYCCGGGGGGSCESTEQQQEKTIGCKRCNSRRSCVVFLPCR